MERMLIAEGRRAKERMGEKNLSALISERKMAD
jgi:hypothetical protein